MFRKFRQFFLLPLVCLAFTSGVLAIAGATLGITSVHAEAWYGWLLLGLAGVSYGLMTVIALPTVFSFVKWLFLKYFRSGDTHTWTLDRFYWINFLFVGITMPTPWICLSIGWTASLIATSAALALALPLILFKGKA